MYFSKHHRNLLKQENTDLSFGDLGKTVGAMWKAATPEEKQPFEEQATLDKSRYLKQVGLFKKEAAVLEDEAKKLKVTSPSLSSSSSCGLNNSTSNSLSKLKQDEILEDIVLDEDLVGNFDDDENVIIQTTNQQLLPSSNKESSGGGGVMNKGMSSSKHMIQSNNNRTGPIGLQPLNNMSLSHMGGGTMNLQQTSGHLGINADLGGNMSIHQGHANINNSSINIPSNNNNMQHHGSIGVLNTQGTNSQGNNNLNMSSSSNPSSQQHAFTALQMQHKMSMSGGDRQGGGDRSQSVLESTPTSLTQLAPLPASLPDLLSPPSTSNFQQPSSSSS